MGMLMRREFDLAAVPLTVSTERAEVIDFLLQIGSETTAAIIK